MRINEFTDMYRAPIGFYRMVERLGHMTMEELWSDPRVPATSAAWIVTRPGLALGRELRTLSCLLLKQPAVWELLSESDRDIVGRIEDGMSSEERSVEYAKMMRDYRTHPDDNAHYAVLMTLGNVNVAIAVIANFFGGSDVIRETPVCW